MRSLLLKLSGEALSGGGLGFNAEGLKAIGDAIAAAYSPDLRLGIVTGGGNMIRGRMLAEFNIPRLHADFMGMTATIINALCLQSVLAERQLPVQVYSDIRIPQVLPPLSLAEAEKAREKITIFAGGTGNPCLTTDTAAALRAAQWGCACLLKGTQVDGVYSADPRKDSQAVLYERISFQEVLDQRLQVMDLTAITLCMEHGIPVRVFNIQEPGNLLKALKGEPIGTWVTQDT